jgi:hypothetical protein
MERIARSLTGCALAGLRSQPLTLYVVHQLPLAGTCAADQFFERDAIQNAADGAVHFGPDRFEVAHGLFAAVVREVSRFQARKLDERSAHAADHLSDGDLARMFAQHIAALGSALAPDDVHAFQDLHDLKQKLHRNTLPLRDVLDANGRIAVVVQRQLQNRRTGIFILG